MAMARAVRVALDLSLATCRGLRPGLGIFWQYAKVECAPPVVKPLLQGPVGVKIEEAGAKISDRVISTIAKVIHDMDVAEAKAKAAQEAALKKKIEDEMKAKEEKKRLEAVKAAQKAEAEKKAQQEEAAKKAKAAAAAAKKEDKPKPPKTEDKPKAKKFKPKKEKKPKKKAPPKKKK